MMNEADTAGQKKTIRRNMLSARKKLDAQEISDASAKITDTIQNLRLLETHRVFHIYYPINNEVDTHGLFHILREMDRTIVMPRTDFRDPGLTNYVVTNLNELEETVFNMREPRRDLPLWSGKIDVIFTPGVAFDATGHRLGYGGGFYDRFLADSSALKVALAYEIQMADRLPALDHDVQMDIIITEKRVIYRPVQKN